MFYKKKNLLLLFLVRFPFSPTTLPSFGIPNQMTQAMLSQYGPNTFLYSLWQIDHYAMSYTEEQVKE